MDALLDNTPRLPIVRERVPWLVVQDSDDLRWAVSIHVPLTSTDRCEAIISVGVAPSGLDSERAR